MGSSVVASPRHAHLDTVRTGGWGSAKGEAEAAAAAAACSTDSPLGEAFVATFDLLAGGGRARRYGTIVPVIYAVPGTLKPRGGPARVGTTFGCFRMSSMGQRGEVAGERPW